MPHRLDRAITLRRFAAATPSDPRLDGQSQVACALDPGQGLEPQPDVRSPIAAAPDLPRHDASSPPPPTAAGDA